MDYFGQAVEIDRLRQATDKDDTLATLAAHAKLAWYLRQRDTVLAREHVCSAQQAIEQFRARGRRAIRSLSARLTLVEAEAKWLFCEPGADAAAVEACDQFASCCDDIGQGDALVLQAQINYDNADSSVRARLWERAVQIYRAAGNTDRAELVAAWQGYDATFLDAQAIEAAVIDLERLQHARHPGVQAIAVWSLAAVHYDRSEMAAAIRGYRAALELMDQTGQLRKYCVDGFRCDRNQRWHRKFIDWLAVSI